jgi:hypothetical protein
VKSRERRAHSLRSPSTNGRFDLYTKREESLLETLAKLHQLFSSSRIISRDDGDNDIESDSASLTEPLAESSPGPVTFSSSATTYLAYLTSITLPIFGRNRRPSPPPLLNSPPHSAPRPTDLRLPSLVHVLPLHHIIIPIIKYPHVHRRSIAGRASARPSRSRQDRAAFKHPRLMTPPSDTANSVMSSILHIICGLWPLQSRASACAGSRSRSGRSAWRERKGPPGKSRPRGG